MALNVFATATRILSALVNANFAGLADGSMDADANSLTKFRDEGFFDFVVSGLIIPTSANLTAVTASGIAVVNGIRLSINATSKTYTASKDTYVDLKNDGTYTYIEVALGAASPALTANSIRIAKVVTSGAAVTSVWQADTLPHSWDSLGNFIYNTDPYPKLLGYGAQAATQSNITAETNLTGASITIIVPPSAKKLEIIGFLAETGGSVDNNKIYLKIKERTTIIATASYVTAGGAGVSGEATVLAEIIPTAGSHTYNLSLAIAVGAGFTLSVVAATHIPFISAKMV